MKTSQFTSLAIAAVMVVAIFGLFFYSQSSTSSLVSTEQNLLTGAAVGLSGGQSEPAVGITSVASCKATGLLWGIVGLAAIIAIILGVMYWRRRSE